MPDNISDRNGRALEWAIAIELQRRGVRLTPRAVAQNTRDAGKFATLDATLQRHYRWAAEKVSAWSLVKMTGADNLTTDRLDDEAGEVADIVLTDGRVSLPLSIKHNHEALKHPRPYSLAQACGYARGGAEDLGHRQRMEAAANAFRAAVPGPGASRATTIKVKQHSGWHGAAAGSVNVTVDRHVVLRAR